MDLDDKQIYGKGWYKENSCNIKVLFAVKTEQGIRRLEEALNISVIR